jgi:uncharacterized membrane protein YfcA
VVLLAYVVRGITGFGSGLIGVPLLSMAAPVSSVVPVIVSLDYVASAGQSARNIKRVAWAEQLALVPFSLIGIGLGLLMLRSVPTTVLSRVLGGFVIVYAFWQLLPLPPLRGSRTFAIGCGIMGGLVGALFGTGGPFYAIYFNLRGLDKDQFRATFAINFLFDGGVRLLAYAVGGVLGWGTLLVVALALPFVFVGLAIGHRIHVGLTQRGFVRLVSLILVATGTALLVK